MSVFFFDEGSPHHPNVPTLIEASTDGLQPLSPLPQPHMDPVTTLGENDDTFADDPADDAAPLLMDELEILVERAAFRHVVRRLEDAPMEVLVLIMAHCPGSSCLCLRQVCRYFDLVFVANAVDHLRASLQPPPCDWVMGHATTEHRVDDRRRRRSLTGLSYDAPQAVNNTVISISAHPDEQAAGPTANPLASPAVFVMDGVGPGATAVSAPGASPLVASQDDPVVFARVSSSAARKEAAVSNVTGALAAGQKERREAAARRSNGLARATKFCRDWIRELHFFRNVKHNIRNAMFDFACIEKHSHAAPLLLPNGILCFSRWQLIAIYVRTCDRDRSGFEIPNTAKWIKAGYLGSHTDTVTSMRFDPRRKTMLSSSFDGTIKRWNIREERPARRNQTRNEGLFTCVTSYQISVNGVPANNFQIFSFDVMDLKDIHEQPGEVRDATCPSTNTSLICCGAESGHVALLQIDDRRSATLGLHNTGESRIRQIRFMNKALFASDSNPEGPLLQNETGTVHIIVSTIMAVHILAHTISRRVVVTDVPAQGNKPAVQRRSYQYNGSSLNMTRLQTLHFADLSMSLDVPRLPQMWPVILRNSRERRGQHPAPQMTPQACDTVHDHGDGNAYLTHPAAFFFHEDGSCSVATLNRANKPSQPGVPAREAQPPYRWDVMTPETHGATCGKVSPTNALFAIGTSAGGVKIVAYVKPPRHARYNHSSRQLPGGRVPEYGDEPLRGDGPEANVELRDSVAASSEMARTGVAVHTFSLNIPPSNSADTDDVGGDGDADEQPNGEDGAESGARDAAEVPVDTLYLGPNAHRDPLCQQLCANVRFLSDEPTFVCLDLQPSHLCSVTSIHVDSWKVSTVDATVIVHVYEIATRTLLFRITPGMVPTQLGYERLHRAFDDVIITDCEAKMTTQRHVLWQNGTLLVSPLPVSSHTLVADFTREFEKPKPGNAGVVSLRTADSESFFTADRKELRRSNPDEAGSVLKDPANRAEIPMQRVPLSFHLLYVVLPPLSFLILIVLAVLVSLRLDNFVPMPWLAIFAVHLLLLPHYFAINSYWHKPLLAHYSGLSFFLRVAADILYLLVAPALFALKADGHLGDISWIFVSWPLTFAIVMAFVAARLEDSFEKRHRVTLNPDVARRKYFRVSVAQLVHTVLIVGFVTHFSIYFDGKKVPGNPISSFSYPEQNIFAVFIPAWLLLALYSTRVPSLVSFTPDQSRLCQSWAHYIGTLLVLFVIYLIFAVAPVVCLCLKFDNWYDYTHASVEQRVVQTLSPSAVQQLRNSSGAHQSNPFMFVNGTIDPSLLMNITVTVVPTLEPSSVPTLNRVPMIAIFSPIIFALAMVEFMVTVNLINHVKQFRRRHP